MFLRRNDFQPHFALSPAWLKRSERSPHKGKGAGSIPAAGINFNECVCEVTVACLSSKQVAWVRLPPDALDRAPPSGLTTSPDGPALLSEVAFAGSIPASSASPRPNQRRIRVCRSDTLCGPTFTRDGSPLAPPYLAPPYPNRAQPFGLTTTPRDVAAVWKQSCSARGSGSTPAPSARLSKAQSRPTGGEC